MPTISPRLVYEEVKSNEILAEALSLLERDLEVQNYLRMANVMAVERLGYNDHGVVHSRIVSGSALLMADILSKRGVEFSSVKNRIGDLTDARLIILMGAYLHDIGNSVHRVMHNLHGCLIADRILRRILPKIYDNIIKIVTIKQEILHCIFSHDESIMPLSLEAGVVKVADGTDMAEGRARIPFKRGKVDIHSLSALAIKKVLVEEGVERPIRIVVDMENEAGVFQVEKVLGEKIRSSTIAPYVEVTVLRRGLELKRMIEW
ncbi:MAG: phosphohydrolase [Thermofilum sp. ex4484_15]|nr:MAG: phosphohydrolase [Thermofilum sp. ex4484_15]